MEILAGIAVVLVLVFILTGDWMSVVLAVLGMILLFIFAMLGLFIYFLFRIFRSVKTEGVFSGFEKNEKQRIERAVYEVNNGRYHAAFPAEPFFRARIYREDEPVPLRFSEKRGEVYDKSTVITAITGTAAFALSAAGIAAVLLLYFF